MMRSLVRSALLILGAGLWPLRVLGSETGGNLPWNAPLETLKANLTGPTATVIILIALAFGFAVWSFGDDNRGLFRAFKAIVALAVVGAIGTGFIASLGINACVL